MPPQSCPTWMALRQRYLRFSSWVIPTVCLPAKYDGSEVCLTPVKAVSTHNRILCYNCTITRSCNWIILSTQKNLVADVWRKPSVQWCEAQITRVGCQGDEKLKWLIVISNTVCLLSEQRSLSRVKLERFIHTSLCSCSINKVWVLFPWCAEENINVSFQRSK